VTRALLSQVDIVMGTEEELLAAALSDALEVSIEGAQITSPTVTGDLDQAVETLLEFDLSALAVKRGVKGATVYVPGGSAIDAEPFPVDVVNVLGAGDAFASGFIHGVLQGWDWRRCARMGNACGAIVVTRQGCANFMPYQQETLDFVQQRGGF